MSDIWQVLNTEEQKNSAKQKNKQNCMKLHPKTLFLSNWLIPNI